MFLPPIDPSPSPTAPPAPPALDELAARAAAYARDWAAFAAWCAAAGLDPLPAPPQTVGLYLAAGAERLAAVTLGRRLAAIATTHRRHGHRLDTAHPAIRDVLRGIRRARGTAARRVAPATTPIVKALAAACAEEKLIDRRDRAPLLLGFAAGLRRSELAALDVDDVAIVDEGARLRLRRSKTDPEGAGQLVGVLRTGTASCPVAALQDWLAAAAITAGPLFRSVDRHGRPGAALTGQSVALIVKRRARQIHLDGTSFSGHSLRAGIVTSGAAHGVEERVLMRQTRHRSAAVLRGYIRDAELLAADNVSGRVGL